MVKSCLAVLEVTLLVVGLVFWSTCGRFTTTHVTGTNPTCSTQVKHNHPLRNG